MKDIITQLRNIIISFIYKNVLKRIFFLKDPEKVHDHMIKVGVVLGKMGFTKKITEALFDYKNKALTQTIKGIRFVNPVGLAAGFDKNAALTDILPSVGFGYEEIGSITGEPCKGNSGRRLWRLPKSKSLVVYYGLMNDGCERVAKRLTNKKFGFPIGISIAKTNSKETCNRESGIQDYTKAYKAFENIGDYITVNISCPNAFGGQPFHDAESLDELFTELSKTKKTKPVFIKISPDLDSKEVDDIISVARSHHIDGFVISNLTKERANKKIMEKEVPEVGGLSGKVVENLTNNMIKYIYARTKGEFVIIGCGGVFSAEDAYKKIRLGVSLIQLITGMIYQGPQVISEINHGLVKLLKKDGYDNISQAVGVSNK